MKKFIVTAAAATMLSVFAQMPAQAAGPAGLAALGQGAAAAGEAIVEKTRRRGRGFRRGAGVAAAVTLGVLGVIAASRAARADDYYGSRYERRCFRWRRWCRQGDDRACWKFENRC